MKIGLKLRISTEELLDRIGSAGCEEMEVICRALENRYKVLFPGWEVVFLSAPTGNPQRLREQGLLMIEFIRNHYLGEEKQP